MLTVPRLSTRMSWSGVVLSRGTPKIGLSARSLATVVQR